jgi:hypothetical protein
VVLRERGRMGTDEDPGFVGKLEAGAAKYKVGVHSLFSPRDAAAAGSPSHLERDGEIVPSRHR